MFVKIFEEDFLDFEPLVMRFVSSKPISNNLAADFRSFIVAWFDSVVAENPAEWHAAKEWTAEQSSEDTIVVMCELMPAYAVGVLAAEVEKAFPTFIELRIGHSVAGGSTTLEFDWGDVPSGQVTICGQVKMVDTFKISFTAVTLGQFEEFINSTQYEPVADRLQDQQGFLVDNFILNHGSSRKQPLYGVAHDDATAFCDWAGLCLPSESELARFFEWTVVEGREFSWTGECWTSTRCGANSFVVRDGPYFRSALKWPENRLRKEFHRNQYENPEAPCFRVVKPHGP